MCPFNFFQSLIAIRSALITGSGTEWLKSNSNFSIHSNSSFRHILHSLFSNFFSFWLFIFLYSLNDLFRFIILIDILLIQMLIFRIHLICRLKNLKNLLFIVFSVNLFFVILFSLLVQFLSNQLICRCFWLRFHF